MITTFKIFDSVINMPKIGDYVLYYNSVYNEESDNIYVILKVDDIKKKPYFYFRLERIIICENGICRNPYEENEIFNVEFDKKFIYWANNLEDVKEKLDLIINTNKYNL